MSPTLQQDFKRAMRSLAAAVCIISVADDDGWNGMTATAVTSVSMDPASMLVCINNAASLHRPLTAGVRFCINVLKSSQVPQASAFSTRKRKGAERIANGAWEADPSGLPYLTDAQANLFCSIDTALPYGTHTIFVGRVDGVRAADGVAPLLYQDGQYAATTRISDCA